MTHGSLFSGIGGFDLAAEWMGWQNVFHCEWNHFGKRLLKYYWPNAISYHDITKTDFTVHRGTIDILTGGFPCQPYSQAGKRLGKEDERHLWPHMLRAIREIQPRWVVGENVLGIVSWSGGLVFEEVCADLEAEGYEVQPYVLPAAAVNAPHRRDRVWFVAYAKGNGSTISKLGESESRQQIQTGRNVDGFEGLGDAADTNGNGLNGRDRQHEEQSSQGGEYALGNVEQGNGDGNAADTGDTGLQRSKIIGGTWSVREDRDKFFAGRIPSNWEKFPTVSPVCHGDDGISARLDSITFSKWRQESIKGGGNAVVGQVVHAIFKTIEEYEQHQQSNTMGH